MATDPRTVTEILNCLQAAGDVTARPMFGEYGLYLEGKFFAMVCDDRLFFKLSDTTAAHYPDAVLEAPYPGARPCVLIPPARWSEGPWLAAFAAATAHALPPPARKRRRP